MDSRKMNFLSDKKISPIIKIHRNDMNAFKILLGNIYLINIEIISLKKI